MLRLPARVVPANLAEWGEGAGGGGAARQEGTFFNFNYFNYNLYMFYPQHFCFMLHCKLCHTKFQSIPHCYQSSILSKSMSKIFSLPGPPYESDLLPWPRYLTTGPRGPGGLLLPGTPTTPALTFTLLSIYSIITILSLLIYSHSTPARYTY